MKNNEKKTVKPPRIRFNQFTDDWEVLYGSDLFYQIVDKNHNSDLPILAITQDKGAIPRDEIEYHVSVTAQSVKSYKVVNIGDFIISLRSFQGGIEYSNYHGICSPAYVILRGGERVVNKYFVNYFKLESFIKELNRNIEGIRDGKMISYKRFSEIPIPIPSLEEQEKIAACLSSLDRLIEAEQEKLRLLGEYKRGLMQSLFPDISNMDADSDKESTKEIIPPPPANKI